ncbi:asparagine synthase (glutamine-hydrolyzing) [Vibrio europaeus]|uniref:asparagine synthase (glutamine-hydrolyzing) n=1 Tax=Vibrio europaeus TaxID=300876 RepID=UPI00233E9699|nr:asparagine synthase (glutamine-hydrolyzing) [Vibrio europaeus]MDC5822043.1 asparagine synthase (glutamine-hydrolyzing) [Vibrio europaeus]MDC5855128.1 asparagine synthase (glutamine-hydrolyzing) [Vibrio europaeus]MDC5870110.1 asparagine synthase (glutamine-hydrolyzing) [Vibrio europaeus]
MCGIFYSGLDISDSQLQAIVDLVKRRGPDSQDSLRVHGGVLAHTRLALLDLDPRSNQPFSYKHLKAVFNGEIYNFRLLRESLSSKGHIFTTEGDVEVLLAGYLEYGPKVLDMLVGMFAFVIYDTDDQSIFCARDRLGKKPLFYSFVGGAFTAASSVDQVSTVIRETVGDIALNPLEVRNFFLTKSTGGFQTIYENVYSLGAGEYLHFSADNIDATTITKYWDPKSIITSSERFSGSFAEACDELESLLLDSVDARLIADVPVGVLMSGGIDSTLIAALAQKRSATPIKAFTIAFDEEAYDESDIASDVANEIGLEHNVLHCRSSDLIDLIDDISIAYDEPFADSSALPTLLVSKFSAQHVKAVMTGDGADEVFLGYNRYSKLSSMLPMLSARSMIPGSVRGLAVKALKGIPTQWSRRAQRAFEMSSPGHLYSAFLRSDISSWYKDAPTYLDDVFQNSGLDIDPVSLAGVYDLENYLLNDINVKVDRASMHYSLETRAPFLDHRVVEYGLRLPIDYKLNGKNKKIILKELASRYLPEHVVKMRKRGFSVPLASWFRGELKEYVEDTLNPTVLKQINGVDSDAVLNMIRGHMLGAVNAQTDIWKLIVYVAWMNKRR